MPTTKSKQCCFLRRLRSAVQRHLCKRDNVPEELKAALQACQNMHELLDFLFSTDFRRDEDVLSLFEQRIRQLDAEYERKTILHF